MHPNTYAEQFHILARDDLFVRGIEGIDLLLDASEENMKKTKEALETVFRWSYGKAAL